MKVITTEQGQVLDLVPVEELRPPGGVYLPDFIQSITARYGFISGPTNPLEAASSGAKFQHGRFIVDDTPAVIKELAVYNDGIIVDAFNTRVADLMLDDFFSWTTEIFKLRERRTQNPRTYTSVVVVEFERAAERALGKFTQVSELLSKSLSSAYGWNYEYNLQRIAFAVDPKTIPPLRNTQFFMERRLQAPYAENRWFSGAPMQTEEHLRLLEAIERQVLA
jgi:hypothetical protein